MTTDDSMSDDVFESPEDAVQSGGGGGHMNVLSTPGQTQQLKTPSPTGYRDYKPPADMLRMYEQQQEEAELMVHKVGANSVTLIHKLKGIWTSSLIKGTYKLIVIFNFYQVVSTKIRNKHKKL